MDHLNVRNLDLKELENNRYEIVGSMSVPFTIRMRGVPFEAGERQIYDV